MTSLFILGPRCLLAAKALVTFAINTKISCAAYAISIVNNCVFEWTPGNKNIVFD